MFLCFDNPGKDGIIYGNSENQSDKMAPHASRYVPVAAGGVPAGVRSDEAGSSRLPDRVPPFQGSPCTGRICRTAMPQSGGNKQL